MVNLTPIMIEGQPFTAVTVKLPKTNFMVVSNDHGYIMCGALDVELLNEKLKERGIVAGRAVGVRTIDQLLDAPLESVTYAAEDLGIHAGMSGREALLKMVK
ncbi:YunC family protein [Bacillus halotolerans]|uniref:YunC family protein n=1 Tax=Bacillus halotolerans TaxID=260554 RepID=UPI0005C4418B|nr:YunC family protein [Bacillus halotolerans]UYO31260.1 YunC family protein [Bacillus halotolerans]